MRLDSRSTHDYRHPLPAVRAVQAFYTLDEDKDGKISTDEFISALSRFNFRLSEANLKRLLDKFDKSGDGRSSQCRFGFGAVAAWCPRRGKRERSDRLPTSALPVRRPCRPH